MKTSCLLACALVASSLASAPALAAEAYPNKPVSVIVPFTPGGSNDVLARVLSRELESVLKATFVVENKAGAAGNIGAAQVARAAPDGYTLLVTPSSITTMNPNLYQNMPFDATKDFAQISLLGNVPIALVVHPSVPATSVEELIAYAKKKPGELAYGSSGIGSPQQLAAEIFKSMAGVEMVNVPYRGATPAIADLLAGRVHVLFGPINSIMPHIESGALRALGVTSAEPTPLLPGVPPIATVGLPGYDFTIWTGLDAPAGTPQPVIDRLNGALVDILAKPEVKATLAAQGIEAASSTPQGLKDMTRADYARWQKLIADLGIPKQ